MNYHLLIENLTNPALLFFILGIIAVLVKSDLEIPPNSSKFISLYLLFAIGFKGGQELSHETFNTEIAASMLFGIGISMAIPIYIFFLLKKQLNPHNAAAIAEARPRQLRRKAGSNGGHICLHALQRCGVVGS